MIKVLRVGYNSIHDKFFYVHRPNGYKWHLLLLVKSPAVFVLNGVEIITPANTLILYDKYFPQEYRANGVEYRNDWIHFEMDGNKAEQLHIPLNTPLYLSNHYYLTDLIQKAASEFYSGNAFKNQTLHFLMQIILIKAKEQTDNRPFNNMQSVLQEELVKLRSEIYSNPHNNWSISMMADRLHISEGYLQNIYKNTFFVTCMSDVIESRISNAKELLNNTVLTVGEIADLCGYNNEVHFMRQFKKMTALTPTQYRKVCQ